MSIIFFTKLRKLMIRKHFYLIGLIMIVNVSLFGQKKYTYESVPNDPLNVRIYTLDNGLKVYLSKYEEEPRIQAFITVRVGSKDDPAETTGLAHYFEHLMFKGTPNFGTTDWAKEKVLLDQIEVLFEEYRTLTDPDERLAMYKKIDALSYEASKLAIPNEYDKMMKSIGSVGTNAATSNDFTYYVENVPNNQLENWAKVQADRFMNPILRLFHTELETVYEEKNMSLTNDGRRVNEVMLKALFPDHPYGLQTTLGDAEHLKNPSITNIKNFFEEYYVGNNMAVCLSGDFDYDEAIAIVDKYLGKVKPGKRANNVFPINTNIDKPTFTEVVGLEAENVRVAYKFHGAKSDEAVLADMVSMMLTNGKCGLIDLNISQKQTALWASSYFWAMNDYSTLVLAGGNKQGQSLDEVKDLLLTQVEQLKKGEFEDWLIDATINNLKLREMKRAESNRTRANMMSMAFIKDQDWAEVVAYNDRLSKITKKELVDFANKYLNDNYVVVYKKQGQPNDVPKVEKPPITPIHINRDAESPFYTAIKNTDVKKISPVFVDYKNDIQRSKTASGLDVLAIENNENATFNLIYYFPFGSNHDLKINLAASYLEYLGTSKLSPEEIGQEFYKLAASFSVSASGDETYISLSGLSENQEKSIELLENLIKDCQVNEEALKNLISDILKSRNDAKANQQANFRSLVDYATYGENSPTLHQLSEEELKNITAAELVEVIRNLSSYKHDVLYFGPDKVETIAKTVNKLHKVPAKFKTVPKGKEFDPLNTTENKVYFANYEGPQSYLQTVTRSINYDEKMLPTVNLYNSYFGGGMNAIVFQELREKRGLAYTARARYNTPDKPEKVFTNTSFIATQNDKVVDAFDAFNELFDVMPVSENAFNLAKESMLTNIETNRTRKMSIIWSYYSAKKMGRDYDLNKVMYETLPKVSMQNVQDFNNKYISKQPKTYIILGDERAVDFETVEKKYGKITKLNKETYFGF